MYDAMQKRTLKVKIFRNLLCFLSILLIFGTVAPGFISANSLGVESDNLSIEV
ncbi:hypothetical protein M3589_06920 [Heyndrickxia oleronia]|uniref:hypothetical protein n=1 Tax=Heyndrickxia oleronia TaxID=38875 RepID=UPI00203A81CF|nr:hypothetical protein [Heyndrickxia oleronia]MCM3237454.1 hypothetical protein [Heyndrickxia oleronia]